MVLGQVRRAKNACRDNHGQNIPEKLYFFFVKLRNTEKVKKFFSIRLNAHIQFLQFINTCNKKK